MNIMYAAWAPGCTSAEDLHEAVCFIDLRPVLCGLYVARCSDYCLDVCELLTRFVSRTPPGLQVQAERRGTLLPPYERALPVSNGDVMTVFMLLEAFVREGSHDGGGPPGLPHPMTPPTPKIPKMGSPT